ncbi:hypothetical protein ASE69_06355 [Sphingomonas sp. Leaf208]|uniref:hypothetical protein n=1 Tax=Sphingomonas sp. Leaf208 TaxID=1735679 RepID=UPI0006FC2E80|nr:hypothetical protein [Sphingomonas sp. Leaf208]KQM50981.1 hypothetical protein ASE69_06355 [Sphingomonas sp. Leaf208]
MTDRRELPPGTQALIDLGLKGAADEKDSILKGLSAWFDRREMLRPECTQGQALSAIGDLLGQVREVCEPLMHTAFGKQDSAAIDQLKSIGRPAEQGRVDRLNLLARKLLVAARFFDRGTSVSSMQEAVYEVRAIHAGDDPRLFAVVEGKRKQGRPGNAFRIAVNKLRALEWDAVLQGRGVSAVERHTLIQKAYGVEWGTMQKWSAPCSRDLGIELVAHLKKTAREDGASGRSVFGEKYGLEFADALTFDGSLYLKELRRK